MALQALQNSLVYFPFPLTTLTSSAAISASLVWTREAETPTLFRCRTNNRNENVYLELLRSVYVSNYCLGHFSTVWDFCLLCLYPESSETWSAP